MLKGPDAHSDRFLQDLSVINQRIDKATREVSSGRRINAPSDAPDEISHLLSLRSTLSATEQSKTNFVRIRAEVDTAEQALGNAIEVLDRIQVLGANGASDLIDGTTRKTLAAEVEQLSGQLVRVANTEISGRFVFAGDTDQALPYTFDPTQSSPVSAYGGATSTRQAAHPSGGRFPIAKAADTIFAAPDAADNVFDSVTALRNALQSNDAAGIRLAVANVRSASKYLNSQQAFYGGVQNQVAEASDIAEKQIVRLKTGISAVEDADITASILDLNTATQTREAAFTAEGRRPQNSLFNYLR